MNIVEFFQQSCGKWFSQRTSHHLVFNQSKAGKSDLFIEMLPNDDPAIVQLCQQFDLDPTLALCGVNISWNGTIEADVQKQAGSTLLVPIADAAHSNQGKLLRAEQSNHGITGTGVGRYVMGTDDALTLITEHDALYSEERLWFASPNLRLRTTLLKRLDGFSLASFCSEIRMGGGQSAPSTTGAAAQSK